MAGTTGTSLSPFLMSSSGYALIEVASIFIALCVALVVLRYIVRRSIHSPHGWDDYLIYPALVANIAVDASCIVIVQYGGAGRHAAYWDITNPSMIGTWAKLIYVVEMTYFLAVCLSKVAILALYLRIFRNKLELVTTYVLVGVVVTTWLSETIAACLQCLPFEYQWDKIIPGGHCFNQQDYYRYVSVPNFVTDVVMLILPLHMVWMLNTSRMQKVGLTFVFLTGSIGLVSSCIRFAVFFTEDAFADPTWASIDLNKWTVIEPGMYLISACLPSLRPLLTKFKFGSARRRSDYTDGVHVENLRISLPTLSGRRLNGENDGFQKLGKSNDDRREGTGADNMKLESNPAPPVNETETSSGIGDVDGGNIMKIVVKRDFMVQVSEGTNNEAYYSNV